MSETSLSVEKFFENSDLTLESATEIVQQGLEDADYGELFHEIVETEALTKDRKKYVDISVGNSRSGFGFRVGQGERVGYAYLGEFNEAALNDAVKQARKGLTEQKGTKAKEASCGKVNKELYPAVNPVDSMPLPKKIEKMDEIEAYAYSLDPRITNVTLQYNATSQAVHIITADGRSLVDHRPMTSLRINIMVTDKDGKSETGCSESGYALLGGRIDSRDVFNKAVYKEAVEKALQQAETLLTAEEAPAGVMDVVLSPGWSGVLLHEAIGHGLEGDFNRRDISVYSGKIGQQVAAPEVTVIDQGDLAGERGSLHFDDEGTPTQQNILIEDGVLKVYMQDSQNAQLMDVPLTGNGRRQDYTHVPMPRMTNTYFRNGTHDPKDIIASVKDGLYIEDMAGGQVDITSGKFNMNAKLAYRIRDGKICEAVKGATLTGDGLTVINSITMIGNDLDLEKSAGMCGKNGQAVPVGCGQPTVKVSNMTVGGTK